MSGIYNIYCDESCHLENDQQQVMVLGAAWCPLEKMREISVRLREIKRKHHCRPGFEAKWTKVSPAGLELYLDILDYFFDDDDLHFRAVVIPNKARLRHGDFGQDHDTWYYKMYFVMLKQILDPTGRYRIYLDIKDTRSQQKVDKLHLVFANNLYDFDRSIIERVQQVRSHEVEIIQVTDLLIGALSYVHRGLATSAAKTALIDRIRRRSGHSLQKTTLPREAKINLLVWSPQEW